MNPTKPPVVFAIQKNGFQPNVDSGPPILVRAIVEGLAQDGVAVTRLTLAGLQVHKRTFTQKNSRFATIPVKWTGNVRLNFIEKMFRRVQSMLHLPYLGLLDSLRFYEACCTTLPGHQVCHEYYSLFAIGALLASRRTGVPHVLTVDADLLLESELAGTPLRGLQKWYAVLVSRYLFKHTSKIICVSEAAKKHFVEKWGLPPDKITVLPNGVSQSFFEPPHARSRLRAQLGIGERPVYIFVGSFQPWHGVDTLLESFALIAQECTQAVLLLLGDGPMRTEINNRITSAGLKDRVHLIGQVAHRDIPAWLDAADIAVAPYSRQTEEIWFSPLKLYEYMAAGKAIIASASGQITQVIEPGVSGLLVSPGDKTDLAAAMLELIHNPEERASLGMNARKLAHEAHTWDAVIKNLQKIYQEAVDR